MYFFIEVEIWLLENNFKEVGNFMKIVWNWYDVSDLFGILVIDRV